jgi:hypothetical protein
MGFHFQVLIGYFTNNATPMGFLFTGTTYTLRWRPETTHDPEIKEGKQIRATQVHARDLIDLIP